MSHADQDHSDTVAATLTRAVKATSPVKPKRSEEQCCNHPRTAAIYHVVLDHSIVDNEQFKTIDPLGVAAQAYGEAHEQPARLIDGRHKNVARLF